MERTKTTIELVGSNVYVVEKRVTKTMRLCDFQEVLVNQGASLDTGFLPKNCRRLYKKSNWHFYLFEFPPSKKIVARYHMESIRYSEIFSPDIPPMWNYFFICIDEKPERDIMGEIYFFCTEERLQNEDQKLYHPLITNVYNNGKICTGTQNLKSCTTSDKMEELLAILFNGTWNFDLLYDASPFLHKEYNFQIEILKSKRISLNEEYSKTNSPAKRKKISGLMRELRDTIDHMETNDAFLVWMYEEANKRFQIASGNEQFKGATGFNEKETFLNCLSVIGTFKNVVESVFGNPYGD